MFEALCSTAMKCRHCFDRFDVETATIDIAQPRWVGSKYWSTRPRVAIVMLNPGSGESRDGTADIRSLSLLKDFSQGRGSLADVLQHQAADMPNWGRPLRAETGKLRGRQFTAFYFKGLDLKLDEIAFANIAWCATSGNKYPTPMLCACYAKHTQSLLRLLAPNVVLLSGSATHRFAARIGVAVPNSKIIPMMHYAHRQGPIAESDKLARVSELLKAASQAAQCEGQP